MTDGPEWFAPKRYGYGAGLPIAWQGWAVMAAYLALVIAAVVLLRDYPLAIPGIIVPATALLVLVAARTTRGGWHRRWGKRDRR
jgi:hypothetical protein